jgi:superfamily II DNA helicase RecQ
MMNDVEQKLELIVGLLSKAPISSTSTPMPIAMPLSTSTSSSTSSSSISSTSISSTSASTSTSTSTYQIGTPMPIVLPPSTSMSTPSLTPAPEVRDVLLAVEALERLHGKGSRFRNQEQLQAILASHIESRDLLYVAPTGSGKTLAITIPALMTAGTIAVVIPLVALYQDMMERLSRNNPLPADWVSDFGEKACSIVNPPSILVVSASDLDSQSLQAYLKALANLGKLKRIIFDEAHLLFTSNDYRPSLRRALMLRPEGVPATFLSATFPPLPW